MNDSSLQVRSTHLPLAEDLRAHLDELYQHWLQALRECSVAARLPEPAFSDHLRLALEHAIDSVGAIGVNRWDTIPAEGAREHAIHRLAEGLDVRDVVTEYFLLRSILLDHVWSSRDAGTRAEDVQLVGWAVDAGIREVVGAFALIREKTSRALEGLSATALESPSLDELFPRLLRIVLDAAVDVDTVSLFLRDGDRIVLRGAVGLGREAELGFSLALGEGFAGRVGAERKPLALQSAGTDPIVRSELLRRVNVRALYGLPLVREETGALVGVLVMGSLSAKEFPAGDRLLLGAVARRVAAYIVQHQLRTELEEVAHSRQDALEMLGRVYANAPIGLAAFDQALRFTRVNDRFAEMSGRRPEDHMGRRITDVVPELRQGRELEEGLRRVLETGEPWLDVAIAGETPAARGELRHWIGSFYVVQQDGAPAGVGAVLQDITEQKRAQEFRDHVLGIVSHDFRTPLSVIKLSAEVLLQDEELTDRQAKAVARMRTSVGRLENMVRDLLDLTRSRSGRGIPLERRFVDLAAVCHQVGDEIQATHSNRKVELVCSGDLHGEWDPGRLAQAMSNLLGNAATYGAEATPITVRCLGEDESVTIEVENKGRPIDPELLPHIFDPFRRDERSARGARRAGLGLGLFITREITRAHGGSISVESDERRTVFRLRLPRHAS